MAEELLKVRDLFVSVPEEEKEILHGISMDINRGETIVIMGPNGAGKSTFGSTLMGDPRYKITSGSITFEDEDITDFSADKIAKKGMFLSFQNPIEVPGISLSNFIRTAVRTALASIFVSGISRSSLRLPLSLIHI